MIDTKLRNNTFEQEGIEVITFITSVININNMKEARTRKSLLPKHILGKCSIGQIVLFILMFGLLMSMISAGQKGGNTFFSNLSLAIPGLLAAISGVAAFFTGIVSIVKGKERSILVYLSTAVGFIVLLFCTAEILFPH